MRFLERTFASKKRFGHHDPKEMKYERMLSSCTLDKKFKSIWHKHFSESKLVVEWFGILKYLNQY
jgi:hypothetical protein